MSDAAPIHDAAELTRYIERRYHAGHREQLPPLAAMAAKVEDVYFGDEHVPDGLSDIRDEDLGLLQLRLRGLSRTPARWGATKVRAP